jgi:PPOX class probable F420-dependent enzyme
MSRHSHLPDEVRGWFSAPNLAYLATIEPDGRPQLSVVWTTTSDAGEVVFSTVEGRRKHTNLLRDSRATVVVLNPTNPYGYCEVRGTTVIEADPAGACIQLLSRQYTGEPFTADTPETQRVAIKLRPEKVFVKD